MRVSHPKWKREGFQSEADYKAACVATRKTRKASELATKTKLSHKHVLCKMWERADFHQPMVTVTRENLMTDIGCSLCTIKEAWKVLKDEGSIRSVRNSLGGRGKAVTFRLGIAGRTDTPVSELTGRLEADAKRDAAWQFLKGKYGPIKAMEIMGERGE